MIVIIILIIIFSFFLIKFIKKERNQLKKLKRDKEIIEAYKKEVKIKEILDKYGIKYKSEIYSGYLVLFQDDNIFYKIEKRIVEDKIYFVSIFDYNGVRKDEFHKKSSLCLSEYIKKNVGELMRWEQITKEIDEIIYEIEEK